MRGLPQRPARSPSSPTTSVLHDGTRAEQLAAFFLLYGLRREEVEYVLDTFSGPRTRTEATPGLLPERTSVPTMYDRLLEAAEAG